MHRGLSSPASKFEALVGSTQKSQKYIKKYNCKHKLRLNNHAQAHKLKINNKLNKDQTNMPNFQVHAIWLFMKTCNFDLTEIRLFLINLKGDNKLQLN